MNIILKNKILIFLLIICLISSRLLSFKIKKVYAAINSYVVKATNVNIRKGPGTNYDILGRITIGYRIESLGAVADSTNKLWHKFNYNGNIAYVREDFIKSTNSVQYTYDANFESELSMQGFPEDYKNLLRNIHAEFPNWKFELQKVNMDFNYAVNCELEGTRSLVNAQSISSYKSTDLGKYDYTTSKWPTFDGGAWTTASREIVAYYMDPRNFLYVPNIFQFEEQIFNSNLHTLNGVSQMVKNTFLDGSLYTSSISNNYDFNQNNINNVIPVVPNIINDSNNINSIGPGEAINNNNSNIIIPQTNGSMPVVPILENGQNDIIKVFGFSNVIYQPNVNGNTLIVPSPFSDTVQNVINNKNSNNTTNGSFNFHYLNDGTHTYAEVIYDAAYQVGMNPYVLVAMFLQEQGKDGKSDSISGVNSKFPNIYNYGNIGAYAADGYTPVENGLRFASTFGSYNRPWNTKEKAIYGAADYYANNYINKGQDTFYLKKWNVLGENLFLHQYMSNVSGGANEGRLLGEFYDDNLLKQTHVFKIPYYNNMPILPAPMPTSDGSPNNWLKSLNVSNYVLTPSFDPNVFEYTLVVGENINNINVAAEPFDNTAKIQGTGNIKLSVSNTIIDIQVVAANGSVKKYTITVYRPGVQNVVVDNSQLVVPMIINFENNNNQVVLPNIINTNNNQSQIIIPKIYGNNNTNNNTNNNVIISPIINNTNNSIVPNIINNNYSYGKGPGE